MRTLWIILFVVLVLLLLLSWTRVGLYAKLTSGILQLDAKIGLIRIRILPAKERKEKKSAVQNAAKKKADISVKKRLKISLDDIKNAVHTLWPPLKRALNRTRRGIRIHPLMVSVTLGASEDPAAGAELYGYCHAGIWTAMPLLEQLLVIPDPSIHVGIDFDLPVTKTECELGISARVGTLIGVVCTVAFPALKWFLKWKKKNKQAVPEEITAQKPAA